jgi:hypothetical protein
MSSGDERATTGPSDPGGPPSPSVPIPADKDELIRSMARAMRVAFKMASMYNADHPAFKSSVNDLMARLEALFVYINPLSIGFSPHALLIDGRFWEGERTYMDLAQLFHFRKIKRLELATLALKPSSTRSGASSLAPLPPSSKGTLMRYGGIDVITAPST